MNPLLKVDDQPEVRYCNDEGHSAIHLAMIHDRLLMVNMLLKVDPTLLMMETDNLEKKTIIHLAV